MKKILLSLSIFIVSILGGLFWMRGDVRSATSIEYTVAQTPITRTVSLNFVGDILPARSIELTMRKNGYDYPFEKIGAVLKNSDITFANLESPLIGTATSGKTTAGGTTVFRGDTDFAYALKKTGIDIVSIANNHMKDQGTKGIESTLNTLDYVDIKHVGAGGNLNEARRLSILEIPVINGDPIKVGFLAYNDDDVVPPTYHATEEQSGTHIMNIKELQVDITNARSQVDVLVVSMHSGTEYNTKKPNTHQTIFAHSAIEAGADIVVGHHPHVLQPIEIYKGKYIYYSLGNFIFDQPWPDTKQSVLIHMQIDLTQSTSSKAWKIDGYFPDIIPLKINQFQPQKTSTLAETEEVYKVLKLPYSKFKLGKNEILVEKSSTPQSQERGLSHRLGLPTATGMLFTSESESKEGFWMKDMMFPIDIYWFDKNFKLVDFKLKATPESYPDVFYPVLDAQYVLETSQGQFNPLSLTKNLTGQLTEFNTYDKK